MERALKKAILNRKNALFYKTLNGAGVGDLFMSLIHTCELNGANPFDDLTELQRHAEELKQKPSEWMPCWPRPQPRNMIDLIWPKRIVFGQIKRAFENRREIGLPSSKNRMRFLANGKIGNERACRQAGNPIPGQTLSVRS